MFNTRYWNIAIRTLHIAAMGVLLGGHAFDVEPARLIPALWITVVSGVVLIALETGVSFVWFHQGRGLITIAKLILIAAVPFAWDYRFPILLVVVVLASVGSHAPARFRYYSILYREVLASHGGPGETQIAADAEATESDE